MNDRVVVDASVALKWVLREPHSRQAIALLLEWSNRGTRLTAPALLGYEVTNAIFRRVARGELLLEDARLALVGILAFDIGFQTGPDLHTRALDIADQFGRTAAYDAHYLALAEREACEFWTADERLWNTVREKLPGVRWVGEYQLSGAESSDV